MHVLYVSVGSNHAFHITHTHTHLLAFATLLDARLPTATAGAHVVLIVVTCSVAIPTPASGITAPRSLRHKRHPVKGSTRASNRIEWITNIEFTSTVLAVFKHGQSELV